MTQDIQQMTAQAVTGIINLANAGARKLRIRGYRSSSGEVRDLEVELIGSEGYQKLVEQSLAALGTIATPVHISESAWAVAKDEQAASWKATLLKTGSMTPSPSPVFVTLRPDEWSVKVEHLRDLLHEPKTPDIASCRTEVTAAKKLIGALVPMAAYLGAIKFAPGKFDSVEAI